MNIYVAQAIAKQTGISESLVHALAMAVPHDITLKDFVMTCGQEKMGR